MSLICKAMNAGRSNDQSLKIRLQRYKDWKIYVCGKDSIPLNFRLETEFLNLNIGKIKFV